MISVVSRGTLLAACLVVASAFVARPASAGVGFWSGPNCEDPNTVASHFTGTYNIYAKCETMCRAAGAVCRASVKSAVNCQNGESAGYWTTWVLGMCKGLTGTEKTDCLALAKAGRASNKLDLKDMRDAALATCDGFLTGCLVGCATPPAL